MSDGVVLACPLMPEDGHFPIRSVYEVLATSAVLMTVQLAAGRPIVAVSTSEPAWSSTASFSAPRWSGIRRSKCAKYPRLAVGERLVNYLLCSPVEYPEIEGQYQRKMAEGMLPFLKRDADQQWIVDYAGFEAREFLARLVDMLEPAKAFAQRTRGELMGRQDDEGRKLFERYTMLVRYWKLGAHVDPMLGSRPPAAMGRRPPWRVSPACCSWAPRYSYQSSHAEVGNDRFTPRRRRALPNSDTPRPRPPSRGPRPGA